MSLVITSDKQELTLDEEVPTKKQKKPTAKKTIESDLPKFYLGKNPITKEEIYE